MQKLSALLMISLAMVTASAAGAAPEYAMAGTIPGPDGGWDYASVDPARHRLYLAHGTAVTALDLVSQAVTPQLATASRPHEVLPIPGTALLLETDGGTGTARLLDAISGAEKAVIPVGKNPDAAIWDARRRRAIVMNADSGTVSVIDPATAKVVGTVTLAPGLEFAAFDKRGMLYVNNEDRNQIAVIDLDKMALEGWIDMPGCQGPTGMAYAPTADRIVSACGNGIVAVVDPAARKQVSTIAIGKGADAVIGDATRRRLFVPSGGSGTLAVLAESSGSIRLVETVPTEVSARTGAVDPNDGKVYLPSARTVAATEPGGRRQQVPGSFHLLIVAPR